MIKKVLIIFLILMLFPYSFCIDAAEKNGYLVKFEKGFIPDCEKYNLCEIDAEKGIYKSYVSNFDDELLRYIEYIDENSVVTLNKDLEPVSTFSLPADDLYYELCQMQLINADTSWKLETYGNDVKIGVIDSGCYAHSELKGNLLKGWNFLENNRDTDDNVGHGTHVSGIIAAEMNESGVIGVAPKAKIVPLKCFDKVLPTYIEDIYDAICAAVDTYDCKIINMSWGQGEDNEFLKEAITYAHEKGVILVAAVGNYSGTALYYPAAYDEVIGVGSVNKEKNRSYFSQYNQSVTVMAPGETVKGLSIGGGFRELTGTSQATPMISGIAAAALSAKPSLTSEEFKNILISTAEDLGTSGYDRYYGFGLADEEALFDELLKGESLYISPINEEENSSYVLVKNNGTNTINGVSTFGSYENSRFVSGATKNITLFPGKEIILKTGKTENELAHFLWNGLNTMKPLGIERKTIK